MMSLRNSETVCTHNICWRELVTFSELRETVDTIITHSSQLEPGHNIRGRYYIEVVSVGRKREGEREGERESEVGERERDG